MDNLAVGHRANRVPAPLAEDRADRAHVGQTVANTMNRAPADQAVGDKARKVPEVDNQAVSPDRVVDRVVVGIVDNRSRELALHSMNVVSRGINEPAYQLYNVGSTCL